MLVLLLSRYQWVSLTKTAEKMQYGKQRHFVGGVSRAQNEKIRLAYMNLTWATLAPTPEEDNDA